MVGKQMTLEEYREVLNKFAKQKGLTFHPKEEEIVMPLVKGLYANKERYGYPSCPCRLAAGDFEADKDIICPCVYADPDMEEYGKCYCNLYVSEDYLAGKVEDRQVPERRPEEKMAF
jgi:ferredoxin-thioredoxin reductase catalytic subunit